MDKPLAGKIFRFSSGVPPGWPWLPSAIPPLGLSCLREIPRLESSHIGLEPSLWTKVATTNQSD